MPDEDAAPTRLGRYVLYSELASGGMARVHLGRVFAPGGFSKTVAIKRLHPHLARDPTFVTMFLDEARLAARIAHPNVVSIDDVVADQGELFLVMEYIQGETLARLLRAANQSGQRVPWRISCAILAGMLSGIHAAHEARSSSGEPLAIVHRDVSPQNVMVGEDGVARVLDFGVAKAAQRLLTSTNEGGIKGKFAYMAPEQLAGESVDRRCDVFAAGAVAWEMLAGKALFGATTSAAIVHEILNKRIPPPSELHTGLPEELDRIVLKALSRDRENRFSTAEEMAIAIERVGITTSREVAAWVRALAGENLTALSKRVAEVESGPDRASSYKIRSANADQGTNPADPPRDGDKTAIVPDDVSQFERDKTLLAMHGPDSATSIRKDGRARAGAVWGALAVAFAGALVFVGVRALRPPAVAAPSPPAPTSEARAASPILSASPETTPVPASGAPESNAVAVLSSASASALATGPSQPIRQKRGGGHIAPAAPSRPSSTLADKCNPPYETDEQGIRHFKRECLGSGH
jgi:serine/threonine-protein kinase